VWGYAPADESYPVMTPEELVLAQQEAKVCAYEGPLPLVSLRSHGVHRRPLHVCRLPLLLLVLRWRLLLTTHWPKQSCNTLLQRSSCGAA
jgi:hypothetical protein